MLLANMHFVAVDNEHDVILDYDIVIVLVEDKDIVDIYICSY